MQQPAATAATPKAAVSMYNADADSDSEQEDASQAARNATEEELKEKKMAAYNKVIFLLESLQEKVTSEGEEEEKLYTQFKAFCEDTTKDKNTAITNGEDKETELDTAIEAAKTRIDELETTITDESKVIDDTEKEIKEAEETRKTERKEYVVNEADMDKAIGGLNGAIDALKSSKGGSLSQMQAIAKTASTAAIMAETLGLGGEKTKKVSAFFLQEAEPPTEDYEFHSDDVIKTLEGLLDDFRKKKTEIDEAEVKAQADHDLLMQGKRDLIDEKTAAVEKAKEDKAKKEEELAIAKQDLSIVKEELAQNKEYLEELTELCGDKEKTYDQRKKMREDELAALDAAMTIMKDKVKEKVSGATIRFAQSAVRLRAAKALAHNDEAMIKMEAAAEDVEVGQDAQTPPSFLQRRNLRASHTGPDSDSESRQVIINLLRTKGAELKSASLTGLASSITEDPMGKVKTLIQELIERLKKQASAEATQKAWCDKSTSEAKQKRDQAAEDIRDLNSGLAKLEAKNASLTEELELLATDIAKTKDEQAEAEKMRTTEKAENTATIEEAQAGFDAVDEAMTELEKFYKKAAKETTVELLQKGPLDDAPDTGFKAGETYTGAQGDAGGILGMLDVIKSDFKRTVKETEEAEAQAESDHMVYKTESGKSLAEMETAESEKTTQKGSTEEKLIADGDSLRSEVAILESSITELLQLKEACNTGMSYNERVARREDEIAALKQAICILDSYAEYGPGGAPGVC